MAIVVRVVISLAVFLMLFGLMFTLDYKRIGNWSVPFSFIVAAFIVVLLNYFMGHP